jgi:hypothetical protein
MANKKAIYHAAVRTIALVPTRSKPTMRRSHRVVLSRSGQECLAGCVCRCCRVPYHFRAFLVSSDVCSSLLRSFPGYRMQWRLDSCFRDIHSFSLLSGESSATITTIAAVTRWSYIGMLHW